MLRVQAMSVRNDFTFVLGSRLDGPWDFDGRLRNARLLGRCLVGRPGEEVPGWWVSVDPPLPLDYGPSPGEVVLIERSGQESLEDLSSSQTYMQVFMHPIIDRAAVQSGVAPWEALGTEHPFAEVATEESKLP